MKPQAEMPDELPDELFDDLSGGSVDISSEVGAPLEVEDLNDSTIISQPVKALEPKSAPEGVTAFKPPSPKEPRKPLKVVVLTKSFLKKYKKRLIIGVIIMAIATLLLFLAYGVVNGKIEKKDDLTPKLPTPPPTSSLHVTPGVASPTKPYSVLFTEDITTKGTRKLYWQPLGSDAKTETKGLQLSTDLTISYSALYKNRVALVTISQKDKGQNTIWYSHDSGQNFIKLFTGLSGTELKNADTITSMIFSHDGKTLIFGFLGQDSIQKSGNIVKEMDPENAAVAPRDLFNVFNTAGIFLTSYDSVNRQVWYHIGCYFCDGNSSNNLLTRKLSTSTDKSVYDEKSDKTKRVVSEVVVNSVGTKVLLLKGDTGAMGGGQPWTVELLDVATGTAKILTTATTEWPPFIGLYAYSDTFYYGEGKSIYSIDTTGTPRLVYTAEADLHSVQEVSGDYIIASTGTHDTFKLFTYDIKTKKKSDILTGTKDTQLTGIAWGE